ncbi:MAG: bile acid:sodium symporter [Bacteroidales bacterium]|nr:bile acid:sodium symporter [Bacteroidales bacterium]
MQETIEIAFGIIMFVFVAASMITMGLDLTISQIIEPFKNIKLVVLSVIANFVAVPLLALGLVWALNVSEGVRIGILLLSIGGGAPFIPNVVKTAKGNVAGAIGLMLLLLVVTIFYMPLVVPLIFPDAVVSAWDITKLLLYSMLIPLAVALLFRIRFANTAKHIQPFFAKFTNFTILLLVILAVILYIKVIIANLMVLVVLLLFFLGSMGIGYLTGGKNKSARIILSVGTGLRNPPVAMLVASHSFSTEPMAAMTPLLAILVGLSILFPLAIRISKKA